MINELTLDQIYIEKHKLEKTIAELLTAFEQLTDLKIEDVELNDRISVGDVTVQRLVNLKIEL